MKRKIYGENITPACEHCVHGRLGANRKNIYCLERGVTELYDNCKKYKYDPMLRKPRKAPAPPVFRENDFKL